ncbi:PQQ-dependent sugar dehydrogenase [Pseudoxanthomonas sp. Root65]|uniref:PQQ-dependent sugar dehydrogenase n=1 Tax=Pseudoxanthomonas sp. Root65 TaxID=1736576 RepID=UPI0009E69F5A|nr:PQQ-dependent sugar dehydrogenase [Pseudoxanthomonas sp. Root65]
MANRMLAFLVVGLLLAACSAEPSGDDKIRALVTEPVDGAAMPAHLPSRLPRFDAGTTVAAEQPVLATEQEVRVTGGNSPVMAMPDSRFSMTEKGRFRQPRAMAFLNEDLLLVAEFPRTLKLMRVADGSVHRVTGVPDEYFINSLADVVAHPNFSENETVYLCTIVRGASGRDSLGVKRARLILGQDGIYYLVGLQDVVASIAGFPSQEYGCRMAFGRDGKLYISGPFRGGTQSLTLDDGKIFRVEDDGRVPADNPFIELNDYYAKYFWSLGHRRPDAMAADATGRVWVLEHGGNAADELNLLERAGNYGYPIAAKDSPTLPQHETQPSFIAPKLWWRDRIGPASMIVHSGRMFPELQGNALISGELVSSIIHVKLSGDEVSEISRIGMLRPIKEIEEAPDGSVWAMESGAEARLWRLAPSLN